MSTIRRNGLIACGRPQIQLKSLYIVIDTDKHKNIGVFDTIDLAVKHGFTCTSTFAIQKMYLNTDCSYQYDVVYDSHSS